MKKILLDILVNLIGGVISAIVILILFYLFGLMMRFIEHNFWLMIPLIIYVFYLILKEI